MKEAKCLSSKPPKWQGVLRGSKHKLWRKLHYNMVFMVVAAIAALLILFQRKNGPGEESASMAKIFRQMIYPANEAAEELQRNWNHSSYGFPPNVSDWDQQRILRLELLSNLSQNEEPRHRVLIVTGSSPDECEPSMLSHLLLRAGKNKLDYCRIHDFDLYYNMGYPDNDFSDWWVKLPVIRMLMLQHPELEWIWWLDADAVFTDLSFEPPFAELDQYNLVLYGEDRLVYRLKDWRGLSTGNFIIRNCQWSLDLLAAWASMGTNSVREESGTFQSEVLANRSWEISGDDQSGLIVLLSQDKRLPVSEQKWVPFVKLVAESEYAMSADWKIVVPKLELLSANHSGQPPFVTHFAGCLPSCSAVSEVLRKRLDECGEQLGKAFDFGDNQVYKQYGFLPRELGKPLEPLTRNPNLYDSFDLKENEKQAIPEDEFRMHPPVDDWDARRRIWTENNPPVTRRDQVLLVSGSSPFPCEWKAGANILLRGFKNRIDYCRKNGVKCFYNMAVVDKDLTGWWVKLPLLRMLMLGNPGVKWIWWVDSDAAFTDMDFPIPFARYDEKGQNLAMYGSERLVFEVKTYTAINTGDVIFRNCQWTLDLLDRWASMGATKELRVKNVVLLTELLVRSSNWDADDQSVLVYLLVKEPQKWAEKVCLEGSYAMSGHWKYWVPKFLDGVTYTGPEYRPFVTHFAGCHPCGQFATEECLVGMIRTYNYADNQVLGQYGLTHAHLNSSDIQRLFQAADNVTNVHKKDSKSAEEMAVYDSPTEKQTVAPQAEQQSFGEEKTSEEPKKSDEVELKKESQTPDSDTVQKKENAEGIE